MIFALLFCAVGNAYAQTQTDEYRGVIASGLAARKLATTKRILVIGAHPDDEDSQLIAYLSLHDGAAVAYLSLTRGEGGQNSIGGELGPALGLLRTGELLAARAVDGADQFFTRAYDFGFSKTAEETFRHWPRDSILADVVATVRRYRPDEIIAIFTGTPRDGHGQHQVSGILAREAFDAAADPNRFPAQIRAGLRPHRTLRLIQATGYGQMTGTDSYATGSIDSLIGRSYWQLAAISRSRHRSQDMGMAQALGPHSTATRVLESRSNPDSASELKFKEREQIGAAHRARLLSANVQLDAITNVERIVPGSAFNLDVSVWNGSKAPISITRVTPLLATGWQAQRIDSSSATVAVGALATMRFRVTVPNDAAISQPYFLRRARAGDIYAWPAADYAGLPFEPAPVRAHVELTVDGIPTEYDVTATRRLVDPRQGELRRAPFVAPAVSLRPEPTTSVITLAGLAAGTKRGVDVTVELSGNGVSGALDIHPVLPNGWSATPQKISVTVPATDQSVAAHFTISPPRDAVAGQYDVAFSAADSSGRTYTLQQRLVDYPHILNRVLFEPASIRVSVLDARFARGLRVGYVVGVDAPIPSVLEQMGVSVDRLDDNALANADLSKYDAVVIGSRAYEVRPDLVAHNARLLDYGRNGGNLITLYQQYEFIRGNFAPYPMTIFSPHDRVTDESAPVRMLDTSAIALSKPNKIGPADFADWVQERALYMPRSWDAQYKPLLEMSDPGEQPQRGAILTAPLGKGTYTYTGISFFREIPAGVPGALRLFINLLSMGLKDVAL